MARVFEEAGFQVAPAPWRRMPYSEAMARYGSDKPDVRFGLEISDLGEAVSGTEFRVFAGVLSGGGVVRGINAGPREVARRDLDELTEHAQRFGAKGLAWAVVGEDGGWDRTSAGPLEEPQRQAISAALGGSPGDLLLIVADAEQTAATVLGELRLEIARRYDLIPNDVHEILWVVDFPMFAQAASPPGAGERDDAAGRWTAIHHPFTAPTGDFSDPGRDALARLRPRARRHRDRRRLDPHQHARDPAAGLRRARDRRRRRRRRASGSCSTRCASARRRTAASRSESTASSRSSRGRIRSAR